MTSLGLSCAICADSYADSTDICSTRCGHIYHMSCLQQWIRQSDTCPMCNQRQPQPHRIFLDIADISQPTVSNTSPENNGRENTLVIKGVKLNQITSPLNSIILQLLVIMEVPITENDIEDVKKCGKKQNLSLQFTFKTKHHKDLVLKNKHKLKRNAETSEIRIYELLNSNTQELFQYSHKLKDNDYKIFYVSNNKVFVKKNRNTQPINILSKEQVDNLCVQQTRNINSASTSSVRTNTDIRPTNHIQIRPVNIINNTNESKLLLFQYSQNLVKHGYEIIFENNTVFAIKTSDIFSRRIEIISRDQVNDLLTTEQIRQTRSTYNYQRSSNNFQRNSENRNNDSCQIL